jgi:methionyl aminopeptidase
VRQVPARREHELAAMRRAGRVVAVMHQAIREVARPGVTTGELDAVAREVLARRGATSNFLGYHGFPAVICASVNDELIHGIPGDRVLDDGDLLSIDCGAVVDGWHGDAAFTMSVGTPRPEDLQLVHVAEQALMAGMAAMHPGGHVGDIGAAIHSVVAAAGFGSPHDYCGHGIGTAMHEEPDVPNRGRRGKGPRLLAGSVLALEPMLIAGGRDDVDELDDGWTVVSADGSRTVHVEHTVLVTNRGPEILTKL